MSGEVRHMQIALYAIGEHDNTMFIKVFKKMLWNQEDKGFHHRRPQAEVAFGLAS